MSRIIPSTIYVNGKPILPGKTLNIEYYPSQGSGLTGGNLFSWIPIIGPVLDKITGSGLYNEHTRKKYTPMHMATNVVGSGLTGGFIEFLPLIPTAIDILGKLLSGHGVHDYTKTLYEEPHDVIVEFKDKLSTEPIFKKQMKLNGMGVKLLHEPEFVAKLISTGNGIHGGDLSYTNTLATGYGLYGGNVEGLRNINKV